MIFSITFLLTINYLSGFIFNKSFKITVERNGKKQLSFVFLLLMLSSLIYQVYFWFHYFQII